jgi:hypothetical protein
MKAIKPIIVILGFLLIAVCLQSCEKAEKPYSLAKKPGDSVVLIQVNMGEAYENQIYINFLDSNFVKNTVKNNCWDLGFDCNPNSKNIWINGGKGVLIGSIGRDNFIPNINTNKVNWRWDASSGGDSIVLKNWFNEFTQHSCDSIYIIDRGSEAETGFRYYQFKLRMVDPFTFAIEYADSKGKFISSSIIPKDISKSNVYFDFKSGKSLNFEPRVNDWQFCFLRTRWIYYDFSPPLLYTVTGIHINSKLFSVALDSSLNFTDICKSDMSRFVFSEKRDAMGFDWKVYDFDKGRYITRNYVNYLLKMHGPNPKYYKLRFIDFYSTQGVKGSPKFEVIEIN